MLGGLKINQEVFQMCIGEIIYRLPGVIATHDEVCIFAKTPEQHSAHLVQLMQTAGKKGL